MFDSIHHMFTNIQYIMYIIFMPCGHPKKIASFMLGFSTTWGKIDIEPEEEKENSEEKAKEVGLLRPPNGKVRVHLSR